MSKKIIVGSDGLGIGLKNSIKEHLTKKGFEVIDIGMQDEQHSMPYFEISSKAAKAIQSGVADRAILFCGTGMGVAIAANKFKGIYAGVVESEYTAEMCKAINNCNVMTMGARVVSDFRAKQAVDRWLSTEFTVGDFPPEIKVLLKEALVELGKIENENMK